MNLFKICLSVIFLTAISCARNETLNMKTQNFADEPRSLVWLSIPGVEIEHFGMLKLHHGESHLRSSFEQFSCTGQTWTHNLYDLRPNSYQSFLSQVMGTKNIKNTCDDYAHRPLWDYLAEAIDTEAIILESGIEDKDSVIQASKCSSDFLSNVTVLRMAEGKQDSNLFHYQEANSFKRGQVYFDKTCQRGNCFASVLNNARFIFNYLKENKKRPFIIIRDGRYEKALAENNMAKAREILAEIERLTSFVNAETQTIKSSLVLFTSSSPKKVDFPNSGKTWQNFEKMGRGITVKNTSLLSFVMANGAHAQNFCGIYDENEISLRILWAPERKLFNW
jgi:hypothetical protein